MKKYHAIFGEIRIVDIIRETPTQVVLRGVHGDEQRDVKKTAWYSYHDTFEEAKKALIIEKEAAIRYSEKRIEKEREQITKYRAFIEKVKTMTEDQIKHTNEEWK